jgi:hypothetical protein
MTGKPIIHALTRRKSMRSHLVLCIAAFTLVAANAAAANCTLRPKQVVTQFMTRFYVDKKVREAFETWVDPGYIQHNPMAETGRDAAINFPGYRGRGHPARRGLQDNGALGRGSACAREGGQLEQHVLTRRQRVSVRSNLPA